jgi:antirestriction protein ArdC
MSKSVRHRRPNLSDAEREQRRAEQRELVRASIEQLRSSDGWQAYLKARRRLHTYSPRNVLLIVLQHETAETVAGFQAWLRLGYCVRKGEHAIKIWAPCPPTKRQLNAWRDAGADPDQRPRTHWRLASVFAQDQVDPLPPPAEPAPLTAPIREVTGDSHEQLLDRLVGLASEVGYDVDLCADTGRADGSCDHRTKLIQIAARLAVNGKLAVLVHELAHALVAVELGDRRADTFDCASEELVVESIAFCCCQTVGLDTSANSIPYLTSWAEQAPVEVLEQAAQLTGRIADRIDNTLLADTAPGTDETGGVEPELVAAA